MNIKQYYFNKGCLEIDKDKTIIEKLLEEGFTLKTPLFSNEVRLVMEWERK